MPGRPRPWIHLPGYTLATLSAKYASLADGSAFFNIFHYNFGAAANNQALADAAAVSAQAYWSANIAVNISTTVAFSGVEITTDDGVTQYLGAPPAANIAGTASGVPFPQVTCAIIRKRAVGRGRARFGHTCHPGICQSMVVDENNLSVVFRDSLSAFYAGVNDGFALTGVAGATHVLWAAQADTTSPVYSFLGDAALKTARRRAPGRGI